MKHENLGGGADDVEKPVESNRTIQVNWGTFNIPTLLAVASVLWYTATHTATQDARIDTSEKVIEAISSKVGPVDNLTYRLTVLETTVSNNNLAVNQRIDRFSDALQEIRTGIGNLNTSYELIAQRLDTLASEKKAELKIPPSTLPH